MSMKSERLTAAFHRVKQSLRGLAETVEQAPILGASIEKERADIRARLGAGERPGMILARKMEELERLTLGREEYERQRRNRPTIREELETPAEVAIERWEKQRRKWQM